jgi:L-aspartate oxidase
VLVVTKEELGESNTQYAQGGIAVAVGGEEDIALHFEDTVAAGAGLVDPEAARVLVDEGPARVEELLVWGAGFDRYSSGVHKGELMLTREGAHSRDRILHANGDATGREIGRALLAKARSLSNIELAEWTIATRLVVADGRVAGVELLTEGGLLRTAGARAVLLASGGAGQVYSDTTNPPVATGDGISLAACAGAELADMEFYQFHPTALSLPGVRRFLLSEALRGEGAWLRNARGERFMERYHPLLELAPRDVVARAIAREGAGDHPDENLPVYLDMRHVRGVDLGARFPGISAFLRQHGLDLARDLIPVRPAAHYLMGGVRTDLEARTSIPGLFAAGEVACTGVHGANRLASNSLLEGLVFGARAALCMCQEALEPARTTLADSTRQASPVEFPELEPWIANLQGRMWHHAGLLRDRALLESADIEELPAALRNSPADQWSRRAWEAHSLRSVAQAILQCALAREESRGAHFRSDFPERDDARYAGRHTLLGPRGLRFGSLTEPRMHEASAAAATGR